MALASRCSGGRLSPAALFYGLTSALAWGAADFLGGLTSRRAGTLAVLVVTQSTGLMLSLALAFGTGEPAPPAVAIALALAAGVAGIVGLGCFYAALARGMMSLVAPLGAMVGAVIPVAFGLVTGDQLVPSQFLGMGCAVAAIGLIARQEGGGAEARQLPLVFLTGLGFAGFFILISLSEEAGGVTWWPIFFARVAGVSLVLAASLRVSRTVSLPRAVLPLTILVGLGDLAGSALFLLASAEGALSVAVILVSLYPVVTVFLAALLLRERLSRTQGAAVGLALAGIALIAARISV